MSQVLEFITNHWALVLLFLGTLGMVVFSEIQRQARGLKDIGPMEATRLLNHEDAVFVDTREDKEYQQGHILNAVHIPLSAFKDRFNELEKFKGRPIIAYCRSGHRSGNAGSLLRKQGFESVFNLGGGILAWQNANLPVTKK